jgi:tetratricopeptide (TPR) repeat protein
MTGRSSQALLAEGDEAIAEAGFRSGDFKKAASLLEAALERASEDGDEMMVARAYDAIGLLMHYDNITKLMGGAGVDPVDVDLEAELFAAALATQEDVGDVAGRAQSLFGLGLVAQVLRRDWATAMPYFWEALEIVDSPDAGCDLYTRSEVHRHVGFYYLVEDVQPDQAVLHLQVSLELREELGDARRIPSGLVALGQAELGAGNPSRAVGLLREAVTQAHLARLLPARIADAEGVLLEAEAAL